MPFRGIIAPLASSKTLVYVGTLAMLMGIYSCLAMWKEHSVLKDYGDIPSQIHAALSLALGWLLVFRTNAAYARWWEARTLWGTLVNTSRNLAIKLTTFGRLNGEEAILLRNAIVGFPRALKLHLRRAAGTIPKATGSDSVHEPMEIATKAYRWLADQRNTRAIDGDVMRILDNELVRWMEVCGACERIAKTPIVTSYRIFARQCIALFLLTFPWGIVRDFGWWTVPLTVIVSYFMIGIETVAEHVEEPFGLDEDDLDLEGMCNTIERSVHAVFAQGNAK